MRDRAGATEFLGYDTEEAAGIVAALVTEGAEVQRLKTGQSGAVILNQTPFYGESGGQVGDTGIFQRRAFAFVSPTHRKSSATSSFIPAWSNKAN